MSLIARFTALALMLLPASALAADPQVIRIGTPDQSTGPTPSGGISLVTYLDVKQLLANEFAKDGIKVEWIYFKGAGPAVNEALANKQLDFVYLGDLASIIGRAGGLGTKLIVPVRGSNAYLAVAPGSGIKTLADLKGKRLTVFKGTAYQLSLDHALASVGLTERDLQVVNLDWTAAVAAIAAKQLDANWAGGQSLTLKEKGLAEIPVSTKTLGPQYTFQAGFLGTEDFIAAHPDLTQRFVNVIVAADHELSQPANFDDFIKVTAGRSGTPESLGKAEYEGDDLKFRFSPRIDAFVTHGYDASIEQAKSLGLIRKTFATEGWIEPKYVDKAIADAGWQSVWPAYDAEGKPK